MKIILNWINTLIDPKSVKITIFLTFLILFVLEAISSIAYFQKNRSIVQSISSTVASIQWLIPRLKLEKKEEKYTTIKKLRNEGAYVYPSYLFEPVFHDPDSIYHLANVPNSLIILCDSNEIYTQFISDELGFRNPLGQIGNRIFDYMFIGDSFVEGACVDNEYTFAGVFREKEKTVFNMGKGGSGPLFNLATLVEYGTNIQTKNVIWFVFTGNDLQDLREEKTSFLGRYINNEFSQDLWGKKEEVSNELKLFLDNEIDLFEQRNNQNSFLQPEIDYGPRIDLVDAIHKDLPLLKKIAKKIKNITHGFDANLKIVIINHPRYRNYEIQKLTSEKIKEFSIENNVSFIEFSNEYLSDHYEEYYNAKEPHFNSFGYKKIAEVIHEWATSENQKNNVIL